MTLEHLHVPATVDKSAISIELRLTAIPYWSKAEGLTIGGGRLNERQRLRWQGQAASQATHGRIKAE